MMAGNESMLLERFIGTGDTEALAQIVGQYAGLVYGTCLRILMDADQAADATQETFFQLTRRAGEVRGSLAGWLHRVATGKAVDLIRSESARRERERTYADGQSGEDQTWREVSPYVDEALSRLDEDTRVLLVRHYLEGISMTELARQRGLSRATVSRDIESGLSRLRAQLQRQGVLVAAGVLSTLLAQNAARSAPVAVLQQLGKITLAGAKASSAAALPSVVGCGLVAAAKVKVVVVAAIVVAGAGLVTYMTSSPKPAPHAPGPVAADRDERQVPRGSTADSERRHLREADSPTPDSRPVQKENAAAPSPEPVAAQPAGEAQPSTPSWSGAGKQEDGRRDLSSPEAAVHSFTKALISGNMESVMACMLPGGTDYEDVQKTMNAGPDDPDQQQFRLWLQALDPDAEMPITLVKETDRGTQIAWRVTLKKDATMAGRTFRAGDTMDLDATLRKSGDSWLIDGF